MDIPTAIDLATEIQRQYPSLRLCGSLSLILLGVIPKRPVGDLDWQVTDKADVPSISRDSSDRVHLSGIECCVFEGSGKVVAEIGSLNINDPVDTCLAKLSWARKKDLRDLARAVLI